MKRILDLNSSNLVDSSVWVASIDGEEITEQGQERLMIKPNKLSNVIRQKVSDAMKSTLR